MKRLIQFGILATAAVLFIGCGQTPTTPDKGINIVVTNTNTQTQGGTPGTSASPTPGGSTLPPGSYVSIGVFGRSCPSGITDVPAGNRQFKLGCRYDVTATPRDSSQKEIDVNVAGPTAEWAQPVPAGAGTLIVDSGNTYNAQFVAGPGSGDVNLCASVKGTQGCGKYEVVR